jgi:phosphatidylglycerol:prolipoprotein diacylglycerol transferase
MLPRVVSSSQFPFIAFDPVAFSLGPLDVHWYGIMYLLGFLFFWVAGSWVARQRTWWGWTPQEVGDFLFTR